MGTVLRRAGRSLKLTMRNTTAQALLLLQAPLLGLLIGLTTTGSASFTAGAFGCTDARERRVILRNLQDPLAETILRGGYTNGDAIEVDVKDGVFTFEKVGRQA